MNLKVETVLMGLLVGILLYCVCNQLFLVEGVTVNPKLSLKSITNKDDFLKNIQDSFKNAYSTGVMISMGVLNNKQEIMVDGSATILRNDSSWNIWFIPCFQSGARMHAGACQCSGPDHPTGTSCVRESVGFGWIWDPGNLPEIKCLFDQDAATVMNKDESGNLNRCGPVTTGTLWANNHIDCSDETERGCIKKMLKRGVDRLKCPDTIDPTHCSEENEVVIIEEVGSVGEKFSELSIKKPSAILFVYDPSVFGSKKSGKRNNYRLKEALLGAKSDVSGNTLIYEKLKDNFDNPYVVIMESLKAVSEYNQSEPPNRIPPVFVDIVKLNDLENFN